MSALRASASCAAAALCRAKRARPSSASACVRSTTGRPVVPASRSAPCACCASCAWATSARCATTGPAGRSTGWACTIPPGAPSAWTPCGRGGSPASKPGSGVRAAPPRPASRRPSAEAGAGAQHLFRVPRPPCRWGARRGVWGAQPPAVALLISKRPKPCRPCGTRRPAKPLPRHRPPANRCCRGHALAVPWPVLRRSRPRDSPPRPPPRLPGTPQAPAASARCRAGAVMGGGAARRRKARGLSALLNK